MTNDCIFCKIAAGEIPADIVYKNEHVTAFTDLNPQAPTHILIVPSRHIAGLDEMRDAESATTVAQCLLVANEIAREKKLENGYRLVTNIGADGGQSVRHLHFHLLGGRKMTWPPG